MPTAWLVDRRLAGMASLAQAAAVAWVVGVELPQHQRAPVQRPVVSVLAGPEALGAMVMLACSAALADGVGSKYAPAEALLVGLPVAALVAVAARSVSLSLVRFAASAGCQLWAAWLATDLQRAHAKEAASPRPGP